MSTEPVSETEGATSTTQGLVEAVLLEAEDQSATELTSAESYQEPWARYGIEKASKVDLKHSVIEQQAEALSAYLNQEEIILVIGRDCGAPIRDIASRAAFNRADGLDTDRALVFVLRLDDEIVDDDDEIQRPQKLDDLEEVMRVLPSSVLAVEGVTRSILCVEFSVDEPTGFARSLLGTNELADRFGSLVQLGQQLIFVLDLKAQEKIPSAAQGERRGLVVLDWVESLLAYYNESWDLDPKTISNAAQELKSAFINRPEREAALYSIIYALKSNSFRGRSAEFEDRIRDAIAESQKTGETIRLLGNYFSSGNRIEQTILALAAFGPTMSHRTFAALGELFLPDEKIPFAFLPEYARKAVEDGGSESKRPTWAEAWYEHLDFYRNKLKIAQSRNQEVELRVNRDSLRDHLLETYPAGLQRIIETIPNVLRAKTRERELDESAIRLLIRLAVTDQRSYDRAWFVKCLLDLGENPSSDKASSVLFKLSTALRVLDEQTSDERPGFADGVFDELVKTLRKRDFPIGSIVELCRRLDSSRFRTQAILEQLLHNSSFEEFRGVLDNIGFAQGRMTPTQRLGLMSSFTKNLLPVEQYRGKGAIDHRAKRALWIWNSGLRADRFPTHVPYRKINLHRTLARELFLGGRDAAKSLLEGVSKFDPRALAFAGRSRRDLRRWLENIAVVIIRAADTDVNSLVLANDEALAQEVSDCIMGPLYGAQAYRSSTKVRAFDELEPPELWRDIYSELDASNPDRSAIEFAERLLLLPLVARSALIAEWFLQLEFATHSIGKGAGEQLRGSAMGVLLDLQNGEFTAASIANDFDYLAGIAANLASWSRAHVDDPRLAEMYEAKRALLEQLISSMNL